MRPMRLWDPLGRLAPDGGSGRAAHTPGRRRRVGVPTAAAEVLGVPVSAVVPLQSHRPSLVLATTLAELAALLALIVTASLAAFVTLVVVSAVLVLVGATNRRQILALTSQGNVALAASKRGWPHAVAGPVDRRLALPEPVGLGGPVSVGGTTWWVDRTAFRLLRHAREVQARLEGEAGGPGPWGPRAGPGAGPGGGG